MRFIIGPLLIVLGILFMKYTVWITNQVGKVGFADDWLPYPFAGTYSWWRFVGLLMIVAAMLWMGGFLDFGSSGLAIPE
ncbi:MAG TPA: hypothetical protein PKD79_01330 [Candidatus Doudnabacteria bacterium]|nr:hypothetical protein [Candidatus Doudnabacteria bacterium]